MDGTAGDGFDYPALLRGALLDLVRRVLARTAEVGLPGGHQLYLTFGTGADGVEIPAGLRRQYPEEMTIVLQHQFWGLSVDDAGFAVTLRFSGRPERLVVPWTALRSFADPSVDFGFRLDPPAGAEQPQRTAATGTSGQPTDGPAEAEGGPGPDAASAAARPADAERNVVDFGAFRRRSDN